MHFDLYDKQAQFFQSTALYRGFVGGRGTGKTFIGAFDCFSRAKPNRHYGIFAPTYKMLSDVSVPAFMDFARPYVRNWNKSDGIITLQNEAKFLCRSTDEPERTRGLNLSGAWLDEGSLMHRLFFDIVIACLREGGEQGWLSATMTPKGKGHWTYDVFGEAGSKAELVSACTDENPFLPAGFADILRGQYTSRFAAQEVEGSFIDADGMLCAREWFPVVDVIPAGLENARGWDLAATAKTTADYTAGVKIGRSREGIFYVCDLSHGQYAAGQIESVLRNTASRDGSSCMVGIEKEGGASGKIAMTTLIRALAGYNVKAMEVTGDKATRIMPFVAQAEAGNVRLVRAGWNKVWLDEMTSFPEAAHDDIVDATAHAFNRLTKPKVSMIII